MAGAIFFGTSFRFWSGLTAALVAIGFIFAFVGRVPVIDALDEALFDRYQVLKPRAFNPEGVVRIIDIDERSINEFGQWPWPRWVIAEIVERVGKAGAAVVAFDIAFAEEDRTSLDKVRADLERANVRFSSGLGESSKAFLEFLAIEDLPDHDRIFAQTMAQYPVVLGSFLTSEESDGVLRIKSGVSPQGDPDIHEVLETFQGIVSNIPPLAEAATGIGSVSLSPNEGAVVRRVPMVANLDGSIVPAFSVEALRVAQRAGSTLLRASDASGDTDFRKQAEVTSMRVGGIVIPLEADGTLRVRYTGHRDQRFFSASDILEGAALNPALTGELAGRIILVGTSAAGLRDLVSTPVNASVPGVEVHAEIIEQVVEQDFFTRPDWGPAVELIVLVVGLSVSVVLLGMKKQVAALLFAASAVAGAFGGSWYLFTDYDLLLSPVTPAVALACTHLVGTAVSFFESERSRREVTRQFKHFVSPEVIDDIVADPDKHLTPGGDRRELSIFFMDVQDFSTHTETMEPEEVVTFLNTLLNPLTDVILKNQGTVDKYIGDSIMAFWNAPRLTPDKEDKAIRAAIECHQATDGINAEYRRLGLPQIKIRMGINTGYCSVGNLGSTRRLSYSCVGDAVNLAARLEGLTRQYEVPILVGDTTAASATAFTCLALDMVAVKGRSQYERVWAVLGPGDLSETQVFQDLEDAMGAGHEAYIQRDWDKAAEAFRRCAAMEPVGLFDPKCTADLFLGRIEEYREVPPPPEWDGTYVATRK